MIRWLPLLLLSACQCLSVGGFTTSSTVGRHGHRSSLLSPLPLRPSFLGIVHQRYEPSAAVAASCARRKPSLLFMSNASPDGETLQQLFTRYCDSDGLMTKLDIRNVPAIAELLVSNNFHCQVEFLRKQPQDKTFPRMTNIALELLRD